MHGGRSGVAVLAAALACSSSGPAGDATEDAVASTGTSELGSSGASTAALDGTTSIAGTTAASTESGTTGAPITPIDCTDACVDTTGEVGVALCHACRCKAAFDNWLPTRDEVQCELGTPIVAYHADVTHAPAELVPAAEGATACANPSLLTGSCAQGSRLGQLQHGDVMLRWICRDPHDDGGRIRYADVGAIGQNTRTGATCYWDDIDEVTHDDDFPPLDLLEASDAERIDSAARFYHTEGETCLGCHDHDPFVYTPYLQSTGWISVAAAKGPYAVVGLDGSLAPSDVQHLVSPEVAACTACHRIGSHETCNSFVADSLGLAKGSDYEPEIHDAMAPGSPHWKLAVWMPDASVVVPDFDAWRMTFASARDHLQTCCAAPGSSTNGCMWDPVPSE